MLSGARSRGQLPSPTGASHQGRCPDGCREAPPSPPGIRELRGAEGGCIWRGRACQGAGNPGPQAAGDHESAHCRHPGQEELPSP